MARPRRYVFFDLETGGLEAGKHPIIQMAAVAVDAEFAEVDSLEMKLKFDEAHATAKALEVNHYDAKEWERVAVDPGVAVSRFAGFLSKYACVEMMSKRNTPYYVARLGGHNAAHFDLGFVDHLFKRHGAFSPWSWKVLDTMHLAAWLHYSCDGPQPKSLSLVDLMAHHGIAFNGDAHDALADARGSAALAGVMLRKMNMTTRLVT